MRAHAFADRVDVTIVDVVRIRKTGIRSDNAGKTVGILGGVTQPDQATPVLAHQGDISKLRLLDEGCKPTHVVSVGVIIPFERFIGAAKTDEIWRDYSITGGTENWHHVSI